MLLHPETFQSSPIRLGAFGDSGVGKTLTATLIAIGLSKRLHNNAPICIADGEDAARFVRPICEMEGVPLFTVPSHSFVDMRDGLAEAEAQGCCAYLVDNYTAAHKELIESAQAAWNVTGKRMPFPLREDIDRHWGEWVRLFRASPLHVLLNGRLGFSWDEVEDETGEARLVKLDTKMRGERDMGYEPDLLIELDAIRDTLVRDKRTKTKSGLMKHSAVVLKDRWRILNGKTFVWSDINDYKLGQFNLVFKDFWPHIERQVGVGAVGAARQNVARSSKSLFQAPSTTDNAFADRTKRVTIALEELKGSLNAVWPGSTNDEKKLTAIVLETLFQSRSWTKLGTLTPEALESAVETMRLFEVAAKDPENNIQRESDVIALIQSVKDLQASVQSAQAEASVL